jgi:hypothetical protein
MVPAGPQDVLSRSEGQGIEVQAGDGAPTPCAGAEADRSGRLFLGFLFQVYCGFSSV